MNNYDYEIRMMSLSGGNKKIRELLISDSGREIYKYIVDNRQSTASDISYGFDLSIQHASGILGKLYKQGYLRRHEQPQESGGYEWVYYP